MFQSKQNQHTNVETVGSSWKSLYGIGGVAALMQFVFTLIIIIVASTLGMKPTTADEYFTLFQNDRFAGILRDDFSSLIIIALYLVTFLGLYHALKRVNNAYTTFSTVITFVAVTTCFATHSGFSLLHLSDQFALATTDVQRSQILTAGETIIASDMWNSTAGFMAGILLQGAGVLISFIMLRSNKFSKFTAYAGILANGFDLVQHIISPFAPSIGSILMMIAGPFYLIWFPLLGRDLYKLGRTKSKSISQ